VSRSWVYWDVGYIQHTQEHFFFQVFSRVRSCPRDSSPVTFEHLMARPSFCSFIRTLNPDPSGFLLTRQL
jgi:hypothetical protein